MLLLVVVKSIDLPSLLNLISQTSALSPPTKKVSNGPYTFIQDENHNQNTSNGKKQLVLYTFIGKNLVI